MKDYAKMHYYRAEVHYYSNVIEYYIYALSMKKAYERAYKNGIEAFSQCYDKADVKSNIVVKIEER